MKIPNSVIPLAYRTSKAVYNKEITPKQGIEILSAAENINSNSARDYFNNFKYLIDGRTLTRTLNEETMDYFFKKITQDYGFVQLEISLNSLLRHIEYYENLQNIRMHKTRGVHTKYLELLNLPPFVENVTEIKENIATLEKGLTSDDEEVRSAYAKLIKKGVCFIAYEIEHEIRFAPSRFVGYKNNYAGKINSLQLDGRQTNKRIIEILELPLTTSPSLENQLNLFCNNLNLEHTSAFNNPVKFWQLNLPTDFNDNNLLTGEFPEGKLVERSHKSRERDSRVIDMAKHNFKIRFGKLYCQICKFDFEEKYGDLGKDFIEGHHTIAVSEMPPGHKTVPDNIAMLCSNCHRMVHKKRPWLTMEDLDKLIL